MSYLPINQELHGPIDPTPADLAMEQFRKAFRNVNVFVYEGYMIYRNGSVSEARRIIAENKLPLIATGYVNGKGLHVKYVEQVAACRRVMERVSRHQIS